MNDMMDVLRRAFRMMGLPATDEELTAIMVTIGPVSLGVCELIARHPFEMSEQMESEAIEVLQPLLDQVRRRQA